MEKTLLLFARICPQESKHTEQLFNEMSTWENIVPVRIDGSKPFDIPYEQNFIKQFKKVIILFTMNWFNLPWNLSRYMAEVWRTGDFNLENIDFYTITTTGSTEQIYSRESDFKWQADEYLNNLASVFKRLKANYKDKYFYYGCAVYDENRFNEFKQKIKTEYHTKINK